VSAAAIALHGLGKRFGRTHALADVTFDVPPRTLFGLLGANGAGKTTLFSLVAGFLRPTRGRVEVLGTDVAHVSELRGRLSILPQDALFQANVPVLEQLIFFSQLVGRTRQEAEREAFRALELVGLAESAKKNARVLSHGMSKRLGIAQAFLGTPEVILLDEPTAGLDPVNAKAIRELIVRLKTSATLVISSHDLDEIQEMCSHVAILDHGKLVECGEVAALTEAGRKVRMGFPRAMTETELAAVRAVPGVSTVAADPSEAALYLIDLAPTERGPQEIVAAIVQALLATGLVPRSVSEGASLEARFLELTRPTR